MITRMSMITTTITRVTITNSPIAYLTSGYPGISS
jgi:hypothetical protein